LNTLLNHLLGDLESHVCRGRDVVARFHLRGSLRDLDSLITIGSIDNDYH